MTDPDVRYLDGPRDARLAFEHIPGSGPTVVFLGGYRSEMSGTKGNHLAAHCRELGRAFLRLDYSGHGLSGGEFVDGTIGGWRDDALAVIGHAVEGDMVLVGSSMGGWIMLLVARALGARVKGMIGIAAAPDFTRDLMWNAFDESMRQRLESDGVVLVSSEYDEEPTPVTRAFIEDGKRHLQLDDKIPLDCPVHLLHGRKDPDVPWRTAENIMERLEGNNVTISYFKDGDHRLSEPRYLDFLSGALERMLYEVDR